MEFDGARAGTPGLTLEQRILAGSEEGAGEYLRTSWFYRAMEAIRETRLANGLTQAEVAAKIGTTQSAIARLENAHRGNFSLDRFLEYAWACGAASLDFASVSVEELRRYAGNDPGAPRTTEALRAWRLADAFRSWQLSANFDAFTPATGGNVDHSVDAFVRLGSGTIDREGREPSGASLFGDAVKTKESGRPNSADGVKGRGATTPAENDGRHAGASKPLTPLAA